MPSPIGHAMAGAMVAWIAEVGQRATPAVEQFGSSPGDLCSSPRSQRFLSVAASLLTPLTVACAVLAISPDFDNFFRTHRTYSHSLGAAGIVWLAVAVVAWRLRLPVVRVASTCAIAYATHVLLDWLGRDDSPAGGLMVLWPLTADYYSSGANLFLEIVSRSRSGLVGLILTDVRALAREMLILMPPFLVVMAVRLRHRREPASEPVSLARPRLPDS